MLSLEIIEKIEAKLRAVDPSKRSLFSIYQFSFIKPDGSPLKSFVLDLKDLKIYAGTVENPDSEIIVTDQDFYDWATQKIPYEELKHKVEIKGDLEAVKKLMAKFHK